MPLKRGSSLRNKASFDKVFQNPDLREREGLVLVLGRKNEVGFPRLGVSVKKSDFSLAVTRNKIKRQIKASFVNSVLDLPDLDFIVLARKGDLKEFKKDLLLVWKKIEKNK